MARIQAKFDKYGFYEKSVQTPESHIEMFVEFYKDLHGGKYARALREDFCGTFAMSCEWVKRNRRNTAISLDLDPEPLKYGKRVHYSKLSAEQKSRLQPMLMDVRSVTTPLSDIIIAGNFSFFIFKTRAELREYFRFCRRSLKKGGILVLELAGGPGMIEPCKERKPVYGKQRKREFTYIWDQKSFNPITGEAKYAIHFEMPGGKTHKDVFTYDWRVWTLPEIREILIEAGFTQSHAYWETSHRGRGTGEYARTLDADNAYAYIAYAVGVR